MKMLLVAVLLAGVAVPADAATTIDASFTFDLTYNPSGTPGGPTPVPIHFGATTVKLYGSTAGYLDSSSFFMVDPQCVACTSFAVVGSTVTFKRLGAFHSSNGLLQFVINFDRDLGGDLANATSAAIVSGSVFDVFGGSGRFSSATGPLMSGSLYGAVPEPASWALVIGGLGLAGGLLRRRAGQARHGCCLQ